VHVGGDLSVSATCRAKLELLASPWAGSRQRPGVRIAARPSDCKVAMALDCDAFV